MKKRIVIPSVIAVAIVTLFFSMMKFSENKYKLSCEGMPENELFKQAPHGAMRVDEHVLEVKYSKGVSKFIDKRPYDEYGEGLKWSYCGYNESVKAHLIRKDGDYYNTGSLLFEESGAVINAGSTVIFSPNKQNYIAIEQRYGADGEDWTLFDTSGHKLWSMFSYVILPEKSTDSNTQEVAEFENPTLSDDLEIHAKMFCWHSKKKENVTLKKIGCEWEWQPKIECDI